MPFGTATTIVTFATPILPARSDFGAATDVYDVIVVLDHNTWPRVRGAGSAIFVHLARPRFLPTEGCIALARRDLLLLLSGMGPRTRVLIG